MNCPNDLLTRKLDFYIGNDQLRDHCLINDHAETILNETLFRNPSRTATFSFKSSLNHSSTYFYSFFCTRQLLTVYLTCTVYII